MRGAAHDSTYYLGSECTCENVDAETYFERPPRPHQRTQRDQAAATPQPICVCPGGPAIVGRVSAGSGAAHSSWRAQMVRLRRVPLGSLPLGCQAAWIAGAGPPPPQPRPASTATEGPSEGWLPSRMARALYKL